ncbi:non-specific serine/threonine protein kinase [[Candida] zeylanoides]
MSVSSSLEARQQDEVNSIASIYGDIFTDLTQSGLVWNRKPSPHFRVRLESSQCSDRPTLSVVLDFEFTPTYPLSPPKVTILEPHNVLNAAVTQLNARIRSLIAEYHHEEVCFAIISEVKDMLDEFQSTTEAVLSLEAEREVRLRNERLQLEEAELQRQREHQLAKTKQDAELNQQILRIRGEYDTDAADDAPSNDDDLLPPPSAGVDAPFVFANTMTGQVAAGGHRTNFRFRAVAYVAPHTQTDLLAPLGTQHVVRPHLSPETRLRLARAAGGAAPEVLYLLTKITLTNAHWSSEEGKRHIQDLETELQAINNITHTNVVSLVGFQIDEEHDNSGWNVRILTEYSASSSSICDLLRDHHGDGGGAASADWAVARTWLIQLIPAFEHLHNCGVVHKMVCPLTVSLIDEDTDDWAASQGGSDPQRVVKLCHPSYGYRLLQMTRQHPNAGGASPATTDTIPSPWRAPELAHGPHQFKTDIWDLGTLFIRIMLGYNALYTHFKSPDEFYANFKSSNYASNAKYADLVYDLFYKMLMPKPSRRPSPMELNAVKFVRDGPAEAEADPVVAVDRRPSTSYYDSQGGHNPRNLGRYERDFEEVGKLGKGAFGEVVKARHRIEGTFYAVKKIKHRAHKLDSLLSEVLSLARLNHQYIVRYYGTWVEESPETAANGSGSDSGSAPESESESESESDSAGSQIGQSNVYSTFSRSTSFLDTRDNSFQVDFVSTDPIIEFGYSTEDEPGNDGDNDGDNDGSSALTQPSAPANRYSHPSKLSQAKSILYIQMEFCENNTLLNLIEQGLPNNPDEYWRLFRQLLEAVSYIHREGFIHRDLKPMNIFIDRSNNIKVGDFGLAKNASSQAASEGLMLSKDNQVHANQELNNKDWSTVVGTVFYTANEITTGNYDQKVDMYALGIIFFEMCWSLGTGMERARTLNGLRLVDVQFPPEWKPQYKREERKIIRLLLDHTSQRRPEAAELLTSGLLPVAHQDEIIKEALKSLADPASPWQQQVRETLFHQPYVLARDLMFDDARAAGSAHDSLLFDHMVHRLKRIFRRHGALEDLSATNVLFPKSPFYTRENVYEVLDKSGSILQLPYDLTLPLARYLSKNEAPFGKMFKHAFVYRQPGLNKRPGSMPDKYSAVSFDVMTHDTLARLDNDAECIKVVDEIVAILPLPRRSVSATIILLNHCDVLNATIDFSFGNVGIDDRKRAEVVGILSQLGIESDVEQIKSRLRQDAGVPHTVTRDLIDRFNFACPIDQAGAKLHRAMMDSPHLAKAERALRYLTDVVAIFAKLGGTTEVLFNPLCNYNCKFYQGGVMFQAVHKVDRRRARILSGGRYDSLIESFANKDMATSMTPHAVGFQLSSSFMFLLLKKSLEARVNSSAFWKGSRCDVLISSINQQLVRQFGYDILKVLWQFDVSADIFANCSSQSITMEDVLDQAQSDGANWVVLIKSAPTQQRKGKRAYKALKVKNLTTGKDVDVDYEELCEYLRVEIEDRSADEDFSGVPALSRHQASVGASVGNDNTDDDVDTLSPLFSVDLAQRVTVVPNDAPRGRKTNNKRDKWELENDAKIASSSLMKTLATAPIISLDVREEVIRMISITSLESKDEFVKKVVFASSNFPRSFALNIYNTLAKELARGTRYVVLFSPKTQSSTIVDLAR